MILEQRQAFDEAVKRIETCRRERDDDLDLADLGLTTLPEEIWQLTSLATLDLQNNRLSVLSAEIWQLAGLTRLDLDSNQLNTLPAEIGQLTSLATLDLQNNRLSALPVEIWQLASLTRLDLNNNQLNTLPAEIGQLASLTKLDLSNNELTAVPIEIGQLAKLAELYLNSNELNAVPAEIGRLAKLTKLYLNSNELSAVPAEIGQLASVTELYLSNNRLNLLPIEIGQLASLAKLDLSNNELSEVPIEVGQLANLTELYLSSNELSVVPTEIGQLASLTKFYLSNNQLSALPIEIGQLANLTELWLQANRMRTLPATLRDLAKLKKLFLHGNPDLELSPSILGANPREARVGFASAKSILDFYFARQAETTRPLNEVKLILVGRGGAGKTSTVRVLRDEPFQEGEESTPGISLCDWTMDGCEGEPVVAHIWDFAGQVITHALHQFFFSVRSVYVVVLTGRENSERNDAEYWLRLIKAFGTDLEGQGPPVIVALNKWDVRGYRPHIDRGALRERYSFIRGFVELDCKTRKGISELKSALYKEVNCLNWVRESFPETWDFVRRALVKDGASRAHMSYADYRNLCSEYGVRNEGRQDSLAEVLHNLGAALNYRNDPRLREATVLQPEWLTNNVYSLMRRAEAYDGVLKQSDVDLVMSEERDPAMRAYLMQIMERFEIAYLPRTSSERLWLVPQALPDEQPEGVESFRDATEATRLRYSYSALPEGLVARAIVRLHEFVEETEGRKKQWSSGAVLLREEARALIRTEAQDRQVMITVTGPTKARQQLAGLCQAEMRDIHSEIPGLEPLEETQVERQWISIATLEGDEKQGRPTGVATRDGTIMVNPSEPNNAYSEKQSRFDEIWKPTVFISYSKSNMNQRKRLESELKILRNEGLLERGWHDRMIAPGNDWNEVIQRELREADVVIILTSSAALATDYIRDHEIPKALELHEAGMAVVVPIILEKCRWDKTALGPLTALPEKAKPLNTWTPQSDAWKTVADGLATVFEDLMKAGGRKMRSVVVH